MATSFHMFDDFINEHGFFCPACGERIFNSNFVASKKPCPHLAFMWNSETREYEHLNPSIRKLLILSIAPEDIENDADEANAQKKHNVAGSEADDSLLEDAPTPLDDKFLEIMPAETMIYAFIVHEFSCGPSATTWVVAVHFALDME